MTREEQMYHVMREQQCRGMAELAVDPEVRRRHEELAALHARRAARPTLVESSTAQAA